MCSYRYVIEIFIERCLDKHCLNTFIFLLLFIGNYVYLIACVFHQMIQGPDKALLSAALEVQQLCDSCKEQQLGALVVQTQWLVADFRKASVIGYEKISFCCRYYCDEICMCNNTTQ